MAKLSAKPQWVTDYLIRWFSTGGRMGPDGVQWVNQSRTWMRAFFKELGATEFKFYPNHYCWSLMALVNGQWWFVSCGDCRFKVSDWVLVRTAAHPTDWVGGTNRMAKMRVEDFGAEMRRVMGL